MQLPAKNIRVLTLTENLRLRVLQNEYNATEDDRSYPNYITDLSEGKLNFPSEFEVGTEYVHFYPSITIVATELELLTEVCKEFMAGRGFLGTARPEYFYKRAVLCPKNARIAE